MARDDNEWYGSKACDERSTRLCQGPVITRYGPACDIYIYMIGPVTKRYGSFCVRVCTIQLFPALRHRGAPRKYLVSIIHISPPPNTCRSSHEYNVSFPHLCYVYSTALPRGHICVSSSSSPRLLVPGIHFPSFWQL